MAWFKTDDQLPDHHKARKVRKSHPVKRRDASPFGLWVLAGAWSNDGFVPLEILEDWDDDAFEVAERLVGAGLWHPTVREGEPGYVFHDWHDQNPAKGDNDPSSSGSYGNHIRWHVQRQIVEEECRHCPTEPDSDEPDYRGDIGAMIAPDIAKPSGASLPSRPVPSPIPTRPDQTLLSDTSDEPDRFEEFWDTYGNKKDRANAEKKWALALKKPGVTADMLIAAAAAYVLYERTENEGGRFIMGPAKWLLNERWRDERTARRPAPESNAAGWLRLANEMADPELDNVSPFRQIGGDR